MNLQTNNRREISDQSSHVINIDELPGGEDASRFDGHQHGSSVSFFLTHNRPGTGPSLHRHPYDETFIVQEGRARFTLGDRTIEVTAETIVVVPAGTPHKFENCGPEILRSVNIHPVPTMETEWLE
jgi:mannose-6-phosphate isomerase-like protein (cupin superfamily)